MARCTAVLLGAAFAGCWSESRIDGHFSEAEWEYLQSYRLPPLDPCPERLGFSSRQQCDDAADLGRRLFFDRSYSGPITVASDGFNGGLGATGDVGRVACADCHQPDAWFTDRRSRPNATSLGGGWTGRNATSLVNTAYQSSYLMNGRFAQLAPLFVVPLEGRPLLYSTPWRLIVVLQRDYRAEYDAIFDPDLPPIGAETEPDAKRAFDNIGIAIEAYERRLVSGDSPFDMYLDERFDELSESAKRGLSLFIGPALCSECHNGPLFGDGEFRNTGVQQRRSSGNATYVPIADHGRMDITGLSEDDGRFRTSGLRQIAQTAPYMHAGQIDTLSGVVDFYRWGGDDGGFSGTKDPLMQPLDITDDDAADLVAFLETLTGAPIPAEWVAP